MRFIMSLDSETSAAYGCVYMLLVPGPGCPNSGPSTTLHLTTFYQRQKVFNCCYICIEAQCLRSYAMKPILCRLITQFVFACCFQLYIASHCPCPHPKSQRMSYGILSDAQAVCMCFAQLTFPISFNINASS